MESKSFDTAEQAWEDAIQAAGRPLGCSDDIVIAATNLRIAIEESGDDVAYCHIVEGRLSALAFFIDARMSLDIHWNVEGYFESLSEDARCPRCGCQCDGTCESADEYRWREKHAGGEDIPF